MTKASTPNAVGSILVVEDDRAVIKALRRLFESHGYAVEVCENGTSALSVYRRVLPDAIVLDLHLPGMSGIDVCRMIRSESEYAAIVVLSGSTDVTDRVVLFELGADDYVTKPFSPKELLARVRTAIRHSIPRTSLGAATPDSANSDDSTGSQVTSADDLMELTPQEAKLVEVFLKNPGRVLSRQELIKEVYGLGARVRLDVLYEHITHLRRKLEEDPSHPMHICTVRGVGYKFIP
jgi:DNA-binding response OmpR family regulator